jgi:hypothetical protein
MTMSVRMDKRYDPIIATDVVTLSFSHFLKGKDINMAKYSSLRK